MFEALRIPYTAFVEQQEFDNYARVVPVERLHILPHQNKGLVVTRNYIWDFAEQQSCKRYWTFDDNISDIYRLNQNQKVRVADGTVLYAIEKFVDRYENIVIAGMNYEFFAKRKQKIPPFLPNRRVYSNMLIDTKSGFRNEGFYNDDTDLCLRVLKAGFCTVLFNAFLIKKLPTMSVQGGMTPHYQGDGRYKMAAELQEKHPDVTYISWKWGRYQHHVNYDSFRKNPLKLKPDVELRPEVNNFGMKLLGTEFAALAAAAGNGGNSRNGRKPQEQLPLW